MTIMKRINCRQEITDFSSCNWIHNYNVVFSCYFCLKKLIQQFIHQILKLQDKDKDEDDDGK